MRGLDCYCFFRDCRVQGTPESNNAISPLRKQQVPSLDIFKAIHQRRERHRTKRVVEKSVAEKNLGQFTRFEGLVNPHLSYIGLKGCVHQYKVLGEKYAH